MPKVHFTSAAGGAANEDVAAVRALLGAANPFPDAALNAADTAISEQLLASLIDRARTESASDQNEDRVGLSAEQARIVVARRRNRRRRHAVLLPHLSPVSRAVTATIAAVAVVAAAVLIGSVVTSQPAAADPATPQLLPFTHGTRAGAVATLTAAANNVRTQPDGAGPVNFSRVQEWALNVDVHRRHASTTLSTSIVETWYAPDGTTRMRETGRTTSPLVGLSPQDNETSSSTSTTRPGEDSNRNAGIPTGATAAVRNWLRANIGFPDDFSADVTYGGDITERLSEGSATPPQIGALYRVLATLPGVFDAGTLTDRLGRPGHAVGIDTTGPGSLTTGIEYLIVDPTTGRPLEVEQVDGPNPPPGLHLRPGPIVAQFDILLDSRQVASLGAQR